MCLEPLSLVMEYVQGGNLYSLLHSKQQVSEEVMMKILQGIARGMLHLHMENVIHRDLAARNVLLTSEHEAKISDFGMSRVNMVENANLTQTASGPLKWLAPECIRELRYGIGSDAWAFGVTVVEMYTREDPYPDLPGFKVAADVANGSLLCPIPVNAPEAVQRILTGCFARLPEDRPNFHTICEELHSVKL